VPILTDISLSVQAGEFVGILGHNGMGKTTLLRSLMGYLPANAGQIVFTGRDITDASTTARARAGLGFVPQGREIFSNLTVLENLQMGCLLSKQPDKDLIEEVLATFPRLKAYLSRPGGALSGGEQQLLALARCLCAHPKLVLLDEPTEGIQPSIIDEIVETLLTIRKDSDLSILLVEQNLNFLSSLSDRVLILQKGAITHEVDPQKKHDQALISEYAGIA
jgi:branched-chain amino acid transport system ATP-binding protein